MQCFCKRKLRTSSRKLLKIEGELKQLNCDGIKFKGSLG